MSSDKTPAGCGHDNRKTSEATELRSARSTGEFTSPRIKGAILSEDMTSERSLLPSGVKIRLSKRMGLTGKYSRHEADKLIANGHVTVNGVVAVPGAKVTPAGDEIILVDGKSLGKRVDTVYKFHKPRGVLSSYSDPRPRMNLSSFKELAMMKMGYSGRLDYDSEGLMLFTSDGDLIYKLQRSEFKVEKEYIAETSKDISIEWMKRLQAGIEDGGERFLPCIIERLDPCRYRVILTEGKKRQVRRMFKAAGSIVKRLVRIRIGMVVLGNLPQGVLMPLTDEEIEELKACIELQ